MSKLLKGFFKQIAFFAGVFCDKKARRAGVLFYTYKKSRFFASRLRFFFFLCDYTLLEKSPSQAVFYAKASIKQSCSKFVFFLRFFLFYNIIGAGKAKNDLEDLPPPKPDRAGGLFYTKKSFVKFYNYTIKYTKVDRKIYLSSFIGIVNS